MQPMRFEIVPSPLIVEDIIIKDGKAKRRERRKKEQKARKW